MTSIVIGSGGPTIADGVYSVILTGLGEKTIIPGSGPNTGQEIDIYSWDWAVDEGEYENLELQSTTSFASGPKSKLYSYITALLGGKPPESGTKFEVGDLVGRRALATVRTAENGWPKIENLSALQTMLAPRPVATGTVAAARQTAAVRQPVAVTTAAVSPGADELPF